MAKIIDMMTRKKWRAPKRPQGSARGGCVAAGTNYEAAYVSRRLGDWQQIGEISAPIVGRMQTR